MCFRSVVFIAGWLASAAMPLLLMGAAAFPDPAVDMDPANQRGLQKAVLAGGCFWCTDVTEVSAVKAFYPADGYHQDFAAQNPDNPYILANADPKLAKLKKACPRLVRRRP